MIKYLLFAVIVVVAVGVYVEQDVIKKYFETGDVPTQEQVKDAVDKVYEPVKQYAPGDTSVKSAPVYQAKVVMQDKPEFTLDAAVPVTFRWTPLVPKPQEPVTYRLKVWQLMQGQNGSQAMRSNKPIVTKDVADVTEATVSGIYTGPCRPPYLCDFIWSVEAVTKAGGVMDSTGGAVETSAPGTPSTGTR